MTSATDEDIMSVMVSGAELLEDLLPTVREIELYVTPQVENRDLKVKQKRNLPRNRLRCDPKATLEQYRHRIETERNDEDWESLSDAWLSDYGLYSTESCPNHHVHVIIDIAKSKGVFVKGVCAENKKNGKYVHSTLPDGRERCESNIVYIGGHNRFTGQRSSVWAILPSDKVVY